MAEDQNRSLQDKFMLRLPDGMRDQLKIAADVNNRSMNAEIVSRLDGSFAPRSATIDEILNATLKKFVNAPFIRSSDEEELGKLVAEGERLMHIEWENIRKFLAMANAMVEERYKAAHPSEPFELSSDDRDYDPGANIDK